VSKHLIPWPPSLTTPPYCHMRNVACVPFAAFHGDGRRLTLLEYVLRETEQLHAKVRRYTSPLEHPFFPGEARSSEVDVFRSVATGSPSQMIGVFVNDWVQ